jgi:dethiobiotin synthetase
MGEDFDSLDLIKTLRAVPIVVAPNRLGVINQVLLTLTALPRGISHNALVVLMAQRNARGVARGNLKFLAQRLGRDRVHELPWIKSPGNFPPRLSGRSLCRTLDSVAGAVGIQR